jgi:hypothetical protein
VALEEPAELVVLDQLGLKEFKGRKEAQAALVALVGLALQGLKEALVALEE